LKVTRASSSGPGPHRWNIVANLGTPDQDGLVTFEGPRFQRKLKLKPFKVYIPKVVGAVLGETKSRPGKTSAKRPQGTTLRFVGGLVVYNAGSFAVFETEPAPFPTAKAKSFKRRRNSKWIWNPCCPFFFP
jgi:hypothetical protein